jgi:hypothetical protein
MRACACAQISRSSLTNQSQRNSLLAGNGTKVLHSTYPWVDSSSENYEEFESANLFVLDATTGQPAKRSPAPGGAFIDPFLPAARDKVSYATPHARKF